MKKIVESARPSAGRRLGRWLAAHRGRLALLVLGLALALGLACATGWRPPGPDRHPGWSRFPHLTNPRLVAEEIPDFAARYGRRYHLPAAAVAEARPVEAYWFGPYYRTNLTDVRRLGYRRTGNDFSWGGRGISLGGNERGPARGLEPPHFRPEGYDYLELRLGELVGYFKEEVYENKISLPYFYQYNHPAAATDTLFLRYYSGDYRVYAR